METGIKEQFQCQERGFKVLSKEVMVEVSRKTFGPEYKQARWVNFDEAEILREWVRAANPSLVLESGTANGYSSAWMASGLSDGSKLYTFDPIDRPKMWSYIPALKDKIEFVQTKFSRLAEAVKDFSGRIVVFIDGDHGYESVMEDWNTVQHYLKPGDVVLFHDVRESKVVKAVDDIRRITPSSRFFKFRTARQVGVLLYETQTIPVCDESQEPLVIHIPGEIKGPDKVRDIPGWANEEKPWAAYEVKALHTTPECHYLYKTALRLGSGNYANLGVYKGMSVSCLAFGLKEAHADGVIYSVDDYTLENIKNDYPEKMLKRFNELGIDKYVRVCKGRTDHFPTVFKSLKFKYIFIDAGHRYVDIKNDFEQWSPLLEAEGEIGIHDCEYSNIYKYIEEDILPRGWEEVEHVWRVRSFRRKV